MVKVKIIGAGGYGGVGLVELLLGHPEARISSLVDLQDVGAPLSKLYPHLHGFCDMTIVDPSDPKAKEPVDVVFTATPDGVGMKVANAELAKGAKLIDFSGDFRFNSKESYADYATRIGRDPVHASPELLTQALYGLPELHRKKLAGARLVGNPGCFAVSCILGLAPAVKNGLIDLDSIICDCKTGVSGAGKKPSPTFHYPARYDTMNAYKLAGHQHVCEVERELSQLGGSAVKVTFTAQVLPLCRGIMSCLYGTLKQGIGGKDVWAAYNKFYEKEPFVRVYAHDSGITSAHVRGTNLCKLIASVDERTRRLRVVSHIDNLVKGQAGSAIQNMNLLFGLSETAGLDRPGHCP